MNQADLISAVATTLDLSRKLAEAAVSAVLAPISGALARGEEVKLNGFGAFEIVGPAKALRDTLSPEAEA